MINNPKTKFHFKGSDMRILPKYLSTISDFEMSLLLALTGLLWKGYDHKITLYIYFKKTLTQIDFFGLSIDKTQIIRLLTKKHSFPHVVNESY